MTRPSRDLVSGGAVSSVPGLRLPKARHGTVARPSSIGYGKVGAPQFGGLAIPIACAVLTVALAAVWGLGCPDLAGSARANAAVVPAGRPPPPLANELLSPCFRY